MPIKDKSLYPENWDEISRTRKEAAGWRCEWCGVKHEAIGAWSPAGNWYDESEICSWQSDYGQGIFPDGLPKIVTIVLTVAHLNQDPTDNRPENLAALCQYHHLNHDRPYNNVKRSETYWRKRHNRKQADGQLPLPGFPTEIFRCK